MMIENQTKPRPQANWDWRAAGNFICGGAGTGLLFFAAIAADSAMANRVLTLIALIFVAMGLFCVWLEIGRPWRAMNVFLHAQTSWMTREALVAPPLFLTGLAVVWAGSTVWIWVAAVLALLFLYCQARIIQAAKGIPAWRASRTVPLMIFTGLAEGLGLLCFVSTLAGWSSQVWMPATLVALLVLRALTWRSYLQELTSRATPAKTIAALKEAHTAAAGAVYWVSGLLALVSMAGFGLALGAAGLLALIGGWIMKYTLVVRASFNQGYALPRPPVRGGAALGRTDVVR